ncbi:hypothetical protein [Sphingomonas sp. Leaf37]|uniref:hypothetical protein n=1 Tax=Sphingomonas sp. Leaf37 TaxID=2876552 RepID=UPI001E485E02|nr:hypothetical protein [Sphingomonas sp. Leaf37]
MKNSKRVLDELLSVEAWHTPFGQFGGAASIHADVVFRDARMGQEAESKVRFRVRLRRAEIVLVIPSGEPLRMIQDSVARDNPFSSTKVIDRIDSTSSGSSSVAGRISLSGKGVNAGASISGNRNQSESAKQTVESTLRLILSTQGRTSEGDYSWQLRPSSGDKLEGKVWDAVNEPRGRVRDTRKSQSAIEGTCRIEVRCKKEDILIEDLSLKDESLLTRLIKDNGYLTRVAAAESYIRSKIQSLGLSTKNYEDPFGDICLGEAQVEPLTQ